MTDPVPGSRSWRRLRYEAIERLKQRNVERADSLRAQVVPNETIVAANGHVLVTNRRIVFAIRLYTTRVHDETRDAISFDEITRWAIGQFHDERPLLRLEHAPHVRVEWVAHRLLWHRWGKKARNVMYRESTIPFNRRRDPALRAIVARLEADAAPRGDDFVITLSGTRKERRGAVVLYERMG